MGANINTSIVEMVTSSGPVVKAVLMILVFLSIWSWKIAIDKFIQFRRVSKLSQDFIRMFWEYRDLARIYDNIKLYSDTPMARIFSAGYNELLRLVDKAKKNPEMTVDVETELKTIEKALKRAEIEEYIRLSKGTTFLATVASAAPFIGLFGTVWGIMRAFQGLSLVRTATIQAVAPGISEALIATAIGLAAAIPAAIAYNYFASVIRQFKMSMDSFTDEFVNLAERCFV